MNLTSANNFYISYDLASPGFGTVFTNVPIDASVAVYPAAESNAKVQYTLDRDLADGSWVDWPKGEVIAYTDDVLIANVYAIRLVVLLGNATMKVVGPRYV